MSEAPNIAKYRTIVSLARVAEVLGGQAIPNERGRAEEGYNDALRDAIAVVSALGTVECAYHDGLEHQGAWSRWSALGYEFCPRCGSALGECAKNV